MDDIRAYLNKNIFFSSLHKFLHFTILRAALFVIPKEASSPIDLSIGSIRNRTIIRTSYRVVRKMCKAEKRAAAKTRDAD